MDCFLLPSTILLGICLLITFIAFPYSLYEYIRHIWRTSHLVDYSPKDSSEYARLDNIIRQMIIYWVGYVAVLFATVFLGILMDWIWELF